MIFAMRFLLKVMVTGLNSASRGLINNHVVSLQRVGTGLACVLTLTEVSQV